MSTKFNMPMLPVREAEEPRKQNMTLRQWYAGMAMQGMLAGQDQDGWEPEPLAKYAFILADAMIANEETTTQ